MCSPQTVCIQPRQNTALTLHLAASSRIPSERLVYSLPHCDFSRTFPGMNTASLLESRRSNSSSVIRAITLPNLHGQDLELLEVILAETNDPSTSILPMNCRPMLSVGIK